MEKTFQYQQQIFAGLELQIYNDLLKNDKIFLQCKNDKIQRNFSAFGVLFNLFYITYINCSVRRTGATASATAAPAA